ncbi:MAG TPA: hypothetical protein VK477_12645 [Acidobacteriota bacterium]|nr:hypothetical protein [Acidobacteriota bacterium]
MTLTPEQKAAVASWIAAGDNLSAVQKKLGEQFKISLTYRDVRFLVDDLELELKDPAPKVDTTDVTKAAAARATPPAPTEKKGMLDKLKEKVGLGSNSSDAPADDEDELHADEFPEEEPMPEAPAGAGGVTVDLDRVVRPGFAMSGTVSFSDGVSGKWALDQYGRLMLDTGQPGYKPSAPDVQAFQRELQMQLQRHGY